MREPCRMALPGSGGAVFQHDDQEQAPPDHVQENQNGGVEITMKIHVEPPASTRLQRTPLLP